MDSNESQESVLTQVSLALEKLSADENSWKLIPEVASNLCFAKEGAKTQLDVAAVPGRIRVAFRKLVYLPPAFGASGHVARALLQAKKADERVRSALNVRFEESFLEKARENGFSTSSYDRRNEPKDVKQATTGSMEWGTQRAIDSNGGRVPDCFYHLGDWGKEPTIIIFGENPNAVVEKARRLLR
ncbi:hypothetical protein HY993_00795 [Candidatus Micrarchaeota archaeon]|nr:hypothetical protein [Candidatus Micrarchaeota archaeon]